MAAESFGNIFRVPELKKRILFTLGLLVVYRIGAHIPTPGINSVALAELFARAQGTILGFFDMFSGFGIVGSGRMHGYFSNIATAVLDKSELAPTRNLNLLLPSTPIKLENVFPSPNPAHWAHRQGSH